MSDIDWNKIKTEYVTSNISCRKLAEKYGVSASTLMQKSAAEGWADQRKQYRSKTEAKTIEKIIERQSEEQADGLTKCNDLANALLSKVAKAIEQLEDREMDIISQEKRIVEDEDGNNVELSTKTENLYITKANVQTAKLRQITAALKDIRDVLSDADAGESKAVKLIISKEDYDEFSG